MISSWLRVLTTVLEHCCSEPAVFVGHSVSAMIGILAAVKRPDLFRQLILIGPSACYLNDGESYLGGFEKQDIEGLIDAMQSNYLGWAGQMAPAIMGNVERPELTDIDQMTGLGNRYLFNAELGRRADITQAVEPFSLMVLDLDGFKAVNDTFGHHAGDAVLRTIGRRISKLGSSMAFRLGGDEFAMILERHQGADTADNFARRLLLEICRPIDIGRRDVTVSASIGISAYPTNGKDSDAILRAADFAMYAAKNSGKNSYARYSPELGERT